VSRLFLFSLSVSRQRAPHSDMRPRLGNSAGVRRSQTSPVENWPPTNAFRYRTGSDLFKRYQYLPPNRLPTTAAIPNTKSNPSKDNKKIYQNPYISIDNHQRNKYAICMENLPNPLTLLSPSQRKFLNQFQDSRFNLYAFSRAAHLTPIDAASLLSEPAIQAALAAFDTVVAESTERAACQARLLTLETLIEAVIASKDLVEARRLAQLLLRITGARATLSKDQIPAPTPPPPQPPAPENHVSEPTPHASPVPQPPLKPLSNFVLPDRPPSPASILVALAGAPTNQPSPVASVPNHSARNRSG